MAKFDAQMVVTEARTFLGAPFVLGGRSVQGCDCIGVVIGIARKFGVCEPDFDVQPYTLPPQPELFSKWLPVFFDEIPKISRKVGDIVLLGQGKNLKPRHVGIIGIYGPAPERQTIIYQIEGDGSAIVEHHLVESIEQRIVSVWRWRYEE
jgi:hypothetical protein